MSSEFEEPFDDQLSKMLILKPIKISLLFKLLSIMSRMVFGIFVQFNAEFMCFDFPR